MKQLRIAALAAMLTVGVSGTTLADTDFGTYRHNPMAAIEAGDALGLETIPRSELEEVRGEFALSGFIAFAAALGFDFIFNDGKNTIRTVALIYQRFGHPGFVDQLEDQGIL
jgi:hypothetical protein